MPGLSPKWSTFCVKFCHVQLRIEGRSAGVKVCDWLQPPMRRGLPSGKAVAVGKGRVVASASSADGANMASSADAASSSAVTPVNGRSEIARSPGDRRDAVC